MTTTLLASRGVRSRSASLLIPVAAIGCAASAAAPPLRSLWAVEAPAVDGVLTEWASLERFDAEKLSVAVRNDGRFAYVAIAASDPAARLVLGSAGFTVWFDPAGKKAKKFGITVPPVMSGGPGMWGGRPGEPGGPAGPARAGGEPGAGEEPTPPEQQPGAAPQGRGGQRQAAQEGRGGPGGPPEAIIPPRAIEVAGPGKDDRRRLELAYARTAGIDVAARLAEGVLVYEIRAPLAASAGEPHVLRSAPGAVIGFGLESGKLERPERDAGRGGRGGGMSGPGGGGVGGPGGGGGIGGIGGGTGGGGRRGGSGGGMGGGMMGGGPPGGGREGMEKLKPLKAWAVVQLAARPS